MNAYKIMFAIGDDRPGIVSDVSGFLFDRGANIEDSRMAALGGKFTLTVLFQGDIEQMTSIVGDAGELEKIGLQASFFDAPGPGSSPRSAALPLKLDIQAMDHPGIVRTIVSTLHQNSVNIESLDTQVYNAPFSGNPLFSLKLFATVPTGVSIRKVKDQLLDVAAEKDIDLTFG